MTNPPAIFIFALPPDPLSRRRPYVKTQAPEKIRARAQKKPAAAAPADRAAELTAKIKELVQLAKEQGSLTFDDISEAWPEAGVHAGNLEEIYTKLRELEIEIVDQAEMDTAKETEEETETRHLDALDDPVRMYLKQMGAVPLLTREQEVAISKRIEQADNELRAEGPSFRVCRQGTHCPGGKTPGRSATRAL